MNSKNVNSIWVKCQLCVYECICIYIIYMCMNGICELYVICVYMNGMLVYVYELCICDLY